MKMFASTKCCLFASMKGFAELFVPRSHLTEKYFPNIIKSNRNQIVFTMHRLIWNGKKNSKTVNRKLVNTI